ncbi:MAG: MATE family efflux transporter, partial [Bradyrhizobium sp.]
MPEIGVAEIPVDEDERPLPRPEAPAKNALLDGPILRTLLWLAWPNVIALSAGTCVVIAETSYIGRLGVESLAAMALVFPCVILTMTMSGGAMGGGVASAIARALGAGDIDRASTLAAHALLIGLCFGLTFMLGMLIFGPKLLELLGGRGNVLAQAIAYAQIFFGGAVLPWLMNTMAGILRGTGNMKLPSLMILSSAIWQIILGGTLGLGLGPIPQFGMRGVAAGSLIAYTISISIMGWYLFSGRARVIPKIAGLRIRRAVFIDILKVGAISCFSPLQSVLTISIFTHMLAGFGTAILAGYGIGARLEFMLTSVAFAVGIASVPMVGMAVGAERIARARRIAWTAGLVSFVSVGVIGTFIAIFPDLWVNIFTDDMSVRVASRQYLSTAAPMYAFIGLAMSMYFSSQG